MKIFDDLLALVSKFRPDTVSGAAGGDPDTGEHIGEYFWDVLSLPLYPLIRKNIVEYDVYVPTI